MKIHSATFVKSALAANDYPRDHKPEIAFVGRSNVGKSTLMNALLGRKGLAKTSSTPGKTQLINFFLVNNSIYFVDLPGYGYAKVPVAIKRNWARVMSDYLGTRETLRMVVMLVDSRHKPTANDIEMLELLEDAEVPTLIVATKCDKLKRSERNKNVARIRDAFELEDDAEVLLVSSVKSEGLKELHRILEDLSKN